MPSVPWYSFPQTPKAFPLPQNLQIDSPHYYAMNIHNDKRQTSFLKCYTEVEIYNVLWQLEGKKDIHRLSGSLYFFFFLLMTGCSLVTCFFSILGRSTWESKELILSKCYNKCDYYNYYYYYYYYYYYHFQMTFSHVSINLKFQFPPPPSQPPVHLNFWGRVCSYASPLPSLCLCQGKSCLQMPQPILATDFLHIDQTLQPTPWRPFLLSICSQK